MLGDKTCLVLCYQSILAARVKLLDLEKIVDRVIRFLEAAMAENLRRSVESFHIAVNGVADEPGSIPPRAMGSSTTSAPTSSPAWSTGLLDAIHWLSQTFLPGSLSSIRYASPQQESRLNAVGQTPTAAIRTRWKNSVTMLGKMSTASKSLHCNVVAQELSS